MRAEHKAPLLAGFLLLALYLLTLAPDVTWWDSGEFIATAHSLGVPHPPGVPLYVLLSRVAALSFGFLGEAAAINLLSALCAAGACAAGAYLLAVATGNTWVAIGGALCAGSTASIWLNATEAEVYAPALLLAALILIAAFKAGESPQSRWIWLTVYMLALAPALHLSVLVAAPAAIVLAMWTGGDRPDWSRGSLLVAVSVLSAGVGTASWRWIALGGGAMFVYFFAGKFLGGTPLIAFRKLRTLHGVPSVKALLIVLLAASCILYLPLRAALDPAINQGNPANIENLIAVLSRSQYEAQSVFPRQAPLWMQLANYLQYLDWQFALGVANTSLPSVARSAVALIFILFAARAFNRLGRTRPVIHLAFAALLLGSTAAVVVWLNLKAGPTIGVGILPVGATHEVRERDYFFLLSFWTIGLLAGAGAVQLAARVHRAAVPVGVLIAALPAVLNWSAADRTRTTEAGLPRQLARAYLETAPVNAVMFVAGDNDSYPLWYLQSALGVRTDVTLVTVPLLAADWYREELGRRHGLVSLPVQVWRGLRTELNDIVNAATQQGRPVVAAVSLPWEERQLIVGDWELRGFHHLRASHSAAVRSLQDVMSPVDTVAVVAALEWGVFGLVEQLRGSVDPTARTMSHFLECPHRTMLWARGGSDAALLDSSCNFR